MGKKLESSFKNMVLVLFGVSFVVSAAVGSINALTADKIEAAQLQKQVDAIRDVVPEFDNDPMSERYTITTSEGVELELYPAKKSGELVGIAVKSYTNNGFSGYISIMVGFTKNGDIYNYNILEHTETPGLGSKMGVWFVKDAKGDIVGKNPKDRALKVRQDGGDVDAITAATITSRAFLEAVNMAAGALSEAGVDGDSGAIEISDSTNDDSGDNTTLQSEEN